MKSIPPTPPIKTDPRPCGYFDDRHWVFEEFGYDSLHPEELDALLAAGWRHFGIHFFRPKCTDCRRCVPIRVLVDEFKPSKSQRRVFRKNMDVELEIVAPYPRLETFHLYGKHNYQRFNNPPSPEFYLYGLMENVCQTKEFRYKLDGKLIASGFVDIGKESLSSMYFVFDPVFHKRGLGTFSILKEIEYAQQHGMAYYYLGYYIAKNSHMAYKDAFRPNEIYNWKTKKWQRFRQ